MTSFLAHKHHLAEMQFLLLWAVFFLKQIDHFLSEFLSFLLICGDFVVHECVP